MTQPYPRVRNVGLFFVLAGIGIAVAVLTGNPTLPLNIPVTIGTLFVGNVVAFRVFGERLSRGEPTERQQRAVNRSTVGMVLLIGVLGGVNFFLAAFTPRTFALLLLFIVGLHFLPMSIAHGPRDLLLGGLACLNAVVGLFLNLPFRTFGYVYVALLVIVGLWNLLAPPTEADR